VPGDAERLRPGDVGLAVVDEDRLGGRDAQVAEDVPVDLGVRLEQPEFPADVAGGEEVGDGPCRKKLA